MAAKTKIDPADPAVLAAAEPADDQSAILPDNLEEIRNALDAMRDFLGQHCAGTLQPQHQAAFNAMNEAVDRAANPALKVG